MRYHKAPAARVYESEQPLRQQHFPEQRLSINFAIDAKRPNAQVYGKSRRSNQRNSQQTVTQMGWAVPEENIEVKFEVNDSDEDMQIEDEREGYSERYYEERAQSSGCERLHKRRRTLSEKTESQNTLTQMHWFVGDSEEDEEDMLDVDGSIHGSIPEESDEEEFENDENFQIPPSGQGDTSPLSSPQIRTTPKLSQIPPRLFNSIPSPLSSMSPSPSKSINAENIPSPALKPKVSSPDNVFKVPKTPQKRQPRREIPSSQSPATTPLSMAANVETPSKSKRTPLAEIPRNELAVRDLSASPSPTKRKTPLKPIKTFVGNSIGNRQAAQNAQQISDSDDDNDDDDEENWDPRSNIPKLPALGKKTSIVPSPADSAKRSQPSQTTDAFTSAYASRSHSIPGPSSVLSAGPLGDGQFTHTLVRSSQASTIDPASQVATQPPESSVPFQSPLQQQILPQSDRVPSPKAISNSPLEPSPSSSSFRTACESSMPELPASVIGSQWQRGRWGACSPVASINESADLVTVSQLVPKDLGKELDFADDD